MKLYLIPQACSLAVHMLLRELNQDVELVRVDSQSKRTSLGGDFREIHPAGYVAALQLDDGQVLTEVTAILLYLARADASGRFMPERSELGDYALDRWLNFISSELQARFDLFFIAGMPEEAKDLYRRKLVARLEQVAQALDGHKFLLGDRYTLVDCYLFTIVRWAPWFGMDLARWRPIQTYVDRIAARPATRSAMQAEALLTAVGTAGGEKDVP